MSKNFSLQEMIASDTAQRKGIDNTPSFEQVSHLDELCNTILQPLRDAWRSGINVNSGFRSKALNKAVGGSSSSAHLLGYAADLYPANGKFEQFVTFTRNFLLSNGIKFDQCITEHSGSSRWLHIGLYNNSGEQRNQLMTIIK